MILLFAYIKPFPCFKSIKKLDCDELFKVPVLKSRMVTVLAFADVVSKTVVVGVPNPPTAIPVICCDVNVPIPPFMVRVRFTILLSALHVFCPATPISIPNIP